MPFLRFSRDKRGYENTFLVHTGRGRGRSRSRILYWFRTPPSVRIGRAALDEDAIRLIEENNPDLEFDWTRILKGQESPEPLTRPEPDRRGSRPPRQWETQQVPTPSPLPAPVVAVAESPAIADVEPEPTVAMERLEVETAALARLGAEGLLRLRARHAEVLARISEKIADPIRSDELKSQAERLNPDTWVTDGDVSAGLEQYEAVFESLRSVVGRRRKRRKRRGGGQAESQSPPSSGSAAAESSDEDDDRTAGDDHGDPEENL